MTRCFVAFELSEDSRDYLEERLTPVFGLLNEKSGWAQRHDRRVRKVPALNWHVTLLFFSDLDEAQRRQVWDEVARNAQAGVWAGLRFSWQGLALWPSPKRPNLICLEALQYEAAFAWPFTACLSHPPFSLGMTEHLRRYRPHLTLMRLKRGVKGRVDKQGGVKGGDPAQESLNSQSNASRISHAWEWAALVARMPPVDAHKVRVDRVALFLSTLNRETPIYPREFSTNLG